MKQTYSISNLIQKQSFMLCTYNSILQSDWCSQIREHTAPCDKKKSHSEHQIPIFASTRVPGDNTTVMIHAINYLTTTNLGVASAHPWFVSVVVACSLNPHWPSEQTLREQGSGWCTPAGRRGKWCNGFSQSLHSEFRVQSSHIPTLYTILSWTEEFRSVLG